MLNSLAVGILLLPFALFCGCTASSRYAQCPPQPLTPLPLLENTKPPPLLDDDVLDSLDVERFFSDRHIAWLDSANWRIASPDSVHLITIAIAQWMGVRYRYGGKSPRGVDCSGFVNDVFEKLGISIPRNSRDIAKVGCAVGRPQLRYGDIVTFARRQTRIHHVGIYLGEGRFAHASRRGVTVSSIDYGYWAKRYVGARRIEIPNIDRAIPPVPDKVEDGADPTGGG